MLLGAQGTSRAGMGIASGGVSEAGPCIVPTAMLGTCSRLSANAAAENPNSILRVLLTHNFRAATASFDPDLPSHLFSRMTMCLSVVSREQNWWARPSHSHLQLWECKARLDGALIFLV